MARADHPTLQVILLPGGVLPASVAYAVLLEEFAGDVHAITKDLELYAGEQPPDGYGLDSEVAGIQRTADAAGFEQFHLVGYSGGGAASLAFAAKHGDRLESLALLEAAWAGNAGVTPQEREVTRELEATMSLPAQELMANFVRLGLRPGMTPPPPPPGPPPSWMAKRPAGLAALMQAFAQYELDLDALRQFRAPVYYALGGLSNPDYYGRQARRLAAVFPNFTLEVYEERHHFDPPHRAEPQRVATALRRLWGSA